MVKQSLCVLLVSASLAISACGGGGGSDSNTNPPPATNQPPTVNAGPDQTVDEQTTVQLVGSASDSDGSVASTNWVQISGVAVDIVNNDSLSASFDAPTVLATTELVFSLTVTDNSGTTASDQTTVTVSPVNASPTVDTGSNFGAYEKELIELNVFATDEDGSIEGYSWEQTLGPQVVLNSPLESTTTFSAPSIDAITQLEFTVTVSDNESGQSSGQVAVTVHPLAEFGGPVLHNTTLNGAYEIISNLTVAPDVTLTISPGSILKFPRATSPGSEFSVSGRLVADGTELLPIFFTYLEIWDVTPSSSWSGIELIDSPNSSITYSIIENATHGLELNGISPIPLQHNVFRENSVAVTDIGGYQAMQVSRNSFLRNSSVFSGIRLSGTSFFSGNTFTENPFIFEYGYYFDSTTIEQNSFEGADLVIRAPETGFGYGTVTAIENWWGTTSDVEIASLITDINDDASLQQIIYTPILNVPPAVVGSTLPSDIELPRPEYIAGTPTPAESGPPSGAPTDLAANETFLQLLVTWTNPPFNVQQIEIWRSTENSLLNAMLLATTQGTQYVDDVGANASYYYWVRAVGTNGAHSAFNDTVGTLGTTGVAP